MGTKERRERQKYAVRTRILDAARELFAHEGYEAVSMRRLAEKIEYSPTALYFHFKDKEALFRELCTTDFLALAEVFIQLARIPDPVERVAAIGREYVRFGLEHPNHYRLMFMTVHPPVEPHPCDEDHKGNPEQDAYAFFVETLRECIAAGRFRPEYNDAHGLAQMLWAATHGVVALSITMADDDWVEWRPAQATAEALIETTIRGLVREGSEMPGAGAGSSPAHPQASSGGTRGATPARRAPTGRGTSGRAAKRPGKR